tara:strand:+ start:1032 stop:1703 length:672 start_codon:yes stop_codon:yes gene_type:complete
MHQRKGKKILIYFFLLIIVGSINNISLNSLKFEQIKNFKIIGLDDIDNLILLEEIKNLELGNIFFIDHNDITNKISSNNLVEKYSIFKRYPFSLEVKIDKTNFLAKISNNGKIFLVGSNGKLIKNDYLNDQLPFIFGTPKTKDFLNFKKIIDESKFSYNEIKNLYFFSTKRWDLELKKNILIKLPNNLTKESMNLIFEFLHDNNFKDIKIIDARIKNQIILND